ncbi:MFS general substrate transporter [Aspergillus brunneoviolaceus CBS 621.78]|uniref:MFS general substrate transporter n=1 Tax=Aspergillus brunneoviolaceus CBS 621.78 TaxID=1450534 RepID=A0ACD1GPA7_9EURO|nr:MFS general substrate transporter [Aspergillus brunneoviolaceus CBS 621.78]RAH51195.1 MFS general substrate transporter [Aspergillus brunneoviolaceus CBS 621.78]
MTDLSENGQVQPPSIESPKRNYSRRHYILIVLSGFMLNFTACGVVFAYGVYQAEYEAMATRPGTPFTGASSAEITLIGSLSSAMMKLSAPFVVAWCKCFSPRIVVYVGGLVFGLSQGLLLGIGSCLSYMPSMIVPPTWFSERRGLALGIISAGTGIGGLVFAPVIQASGRLREEAASKSLLTRLCRVPLPPWALVRSRKFVAQLLNAAFQSAAYYTPVYYISSYRQTLGYSESEGANWTSLSNACNAIGKVAVGYLADYLGRLNSFFGVTLLSAVGAVGLWIPSTLLGGSSPHELPAARACFIVFTVLYGLFASAYIGLFSPALVELFGLEEMPRITGIMYMVQGAAGLVGTPVAGLLVRTSHGETTTPRSYLDMAIFVGALMVASTLAVAWVRVEQEFDRVRGRRSWVWKL